MPPSSARWMADASRAFQKLVGSRIAPCKEGPTGVLKPLGISQSLAGLKRRPLLLAGDEIEKALRELAEIARPPAKSSGVRERCPFLHSRPAHKGAAFLKIGPAGDATKMRSSSRSRSRPKVLMSSGSKVTLKPVGHHKLVKDGERWKCSICDRSVVKRSKGVFAKSACFGPGGCRNEAYRANRERNTSMKQEEKNRQN